MDKYQELINKLGFNRVKLDEPLSPYTNIKIGGPAEFLYEAKSKRELIDAVVLAKRLKIPFILIGLGANILVSDKGVRGLVIVNRASEFKFLANGFIEVDSGLNLVNLIKETTERGYTGLERMIRVPATVGGAIYMNAGDTNKNEFFGDLIIRVEVLNENGEVKKIREIDCEFGYRSSRFQRTKEVILSVLLHLKHVEKPEIEEKMRDIITRKRSQPAGPSVGSTFRNPPLYYAGRLIDQAGLKGKTIGRAKISEKHANFIINTGNASARDVKSLIDLMKSEVKKKFGVGLEEEVRYIGEW